MYELGKQFRVDMNKAIGNSEAIVQGNNYRFTLITDGLIRLEYSPNNAFIDYPSQLVLNRYNTKPRFTLREDNTYLEIKTDYFILQYLKGKSFLGTKINGASNLKIVINEELKANDTPREWYYHHPEAKNYEASSVSLDESKNIKYKKGLYSLDGFASIDDSNSLLIMEDGTLASRPNGNIDIYVFVYNKDFDKAMSDYFLITGKPAFIPRYALGNWWSKDYYYRTDEIVDLINNFSRREVPLSILLLSYWSLPNQNPGYTFYDVCVPNPREMIDYAHQNNIRVGLKINPRYPIKNNEMYYNEALKYIQVEQGKDIPFNVYDPRILDVYLKIFLNPLEAVGVDFFWNDYDDFNNIQALSPMNHYLYLDSGKNLSKRNMLLARNGLIASHRYPVMYLGKTRVSWDNLGLIPFYNLSGANIGLAWMSHDVGGNYGGIEDSELYIRSVELGCFSPILRFNINGGKYYKREPWRWDVKTESIVVRYLQLRHRLIPYLYTEAYNYYKDAKLFIRPFYYEYPFVYDDRVYRNQYFFGSQMMVAPITEKKDVVMNRTIHKFFIPDGVWYDFTTGKKFMGNKKYVSFFKEEDYSVFAKSGAIIPLSNKSNKNNIGNPTELEIQLFPGSSNSYTLYEDDGLTALYKEGFYLKTEIEYNYLKNNFTVIVRSIDGKSGVVPDYRDYKLRFRNTKEAEKVNVHVGDTMYESTSYVEDNDFIVEVKHVPTIGQLSVNCRGQDIEIDAVRVINEDIDSILLDLQIETILKEEISKIMFGELPIKKKRIAIRKLKKRGLSQNHIKLFLKLLEYITTI